LSASENLPLLNPEREPSLRSTSIGHRMVLLQRFSTLQAS
jgi:hypothetical protein